MYKIYVVQNHIQVLKNIFFKSDTFILSESLNVTFIQKFECTHAGNYTVTLKASNSHNFLNDSVEVCCINLISRNWKIETNAPQIVPPGKVILH